MNDTLSHYAIPSLPIGGVGISGFGRTRGDEGLREMSRTRSIFEHRFGLKKELWWFPYSERSERLHRALIQLRGGRGPGAVVAAARVLLGTSSDEAGEEDE